MSKKDPVSSEEPVAVEAVNAQPNSSSGTPDTFIRRVFRRVGRLLWYSTKKIAYIAFLIAVVVLIFVGLDKLSELALKKTHLAHIYTENFPMVKRDLTEPVSHYDYDLTPGVCIMQNQPKGNRYEYTNNAGFRDPRPISLKKPDDEFRIFLTGGSTAFGLGASGQAAPLTNFYYLEHRETISHALEKILNATAPVPGKKIRVYNTAVWGYSYQHLLFRYVTKLRQYKPDLVVSLDGANELLPLSAPTKDWNYFREGQYNGILRQIFAYERQGLASYLTLWLKNNTFLMTLIWNGADPFLTMAGEMRTHRGAVPGQDAKDPNPELTEEERSQMMAERVAAVVRVVEDYHSVLKNDKVPHIVALQPLLYLSKKPRHEWEKKVESLEEHKQYYDVPSDELYRFMIDRVNQSARTRQYLLADFANYFDDTSEWVFTDWCHLTAGANYLIAKELANIIKEHFFERALTEGDKIERDKNSFFWNVGHRAKVVYAPPADDPENEPKNMLIGFPGPAVYSSKEVPAAEKLAIVLDLGREFTLSRLRLVWDDDSVPAEWAVDISSDGETWNPWIHGTNKDLDDFSWWPGYEHYAAEPVQARYLRYQPIKSDVRKIRLRSWSVHR
ncbi:MAG: hypothetical protein HY913_12305 [Desulfomonile tiedjei]|nr:hypothetical protein [Desulfomonile tiedjei]